MAFLHINFMFKNTLYAFFFLVLMASCYSTKKTTYFRGLEDMTITTKLENEPPIIHKNDLLSITVSSLNPDASEVFNNNASSGGTTHAGTMTQAFGYLVDVDGNIQFPILGNIKAEGLTQKQLKNIILSQIVAKHLLLDPIVIVRFLNFRVSIMGEVETPGVYNIPNEKVTLLEALALAGDVTVFAKRDNVLLIREENGERILVRLDMSSSEIFYSPYYYLKSGDVVYVEHNKAKVAASKPIGPWLGAIFSGSSLMILILSKTTLLP